MVKTSRLNISQSKWEAKKLEKARQNRLMEIKSWNAIRDLVILIIFLGCLYSIAFANRDIEGSHIMVKHLRRYVLKENFTHMKILSKSDHYRSFEHIQTFDQYWKWLKLIFLSRIRGQRWYNGEIPKDLFGYLNDKSNRLIGWATLRQLRVQQSNFHY